MHLFVAGGSGYIGSVLVPLLLEHNHRVTVLDRLYFGGTLTRAELAQRYALATGRSIHDIVFYLAFARFKVGVIIQQIYYRYARGLTHDERFATMPHRIAILMRASLQCTESETI